MTAYFYPFYFYPSTSDPLFLFSIILIIISLVLSLWAQVKVKSSFSKYSNVSAPLTGAQAAEKLLILKGITNIKIERCSGNLTDHFDPRTNTIRLSENVYDSASVAAVGVACHEAGHALQYNTNYFPIKLRNTIVPITRFGSSLALPLVLFGFLFDFYFLSLIGVWFYGLATLFQLITLPVEFNASKRAIGTIKDYKFFSDSKKEKGVKSVLTAAALTYVAALLASLGQFLRLFALVNRRR